ncbi:histone-lysine N-methyltransferase SETMAR [Trichonephila clavipes]|nr:histone-lysine N-methyltransferase SETMAR [Trichonephila clavipes]
MKYGTFVYFVNPFRLLKRGRGNLVVKVMDSWSVCHEFEPSTAEDPPCNTPTQIKDKLDSVYGDSTAPFTTVKYWAAKFKRDRKSLGDDERSGRPNTASTDENIAKVHQMVPDEHRIKVREIAEAMNMSTERVCHILNQDKGMRKLSACWVPRLLTLDQKRVRMNISNALLAQFRRNKSKFWRRLITVEET